MDMLSDFLGAIGGGGAGHEAPIAEDEQSLATQLMKWCGLQAKAAASMLCNDPALGFRTLAGMSDMEDSDWVRRASVVPFLASPAFASVSLCL